MSTKPAGLVALRFCFSAFQLSSSAQLTFAGDRGLPSGYAVKPASARAVITPAGEATKELAATEVSPGVYEVEVSALNAGEWKWEGQALNGEGVVTASTGVLTFTIGTLLRP